MAPKTIALAAAAAAVALALVLASWLYGQREVSAAVHIESVSPGLGSRLHLDDPRVPRVECRRPPRLHLVRFEDGSARLECARQLLVRISVPN